MEILQMPGESIHQAAIVPLPSRRPIVCAAHDTKVFVDCHARMCFTYAGLDPVYHRFLEKLFAITDFVSLRSIDEEQARCEGQGITGDATSLVRWWALVRHNDDADHWFTSLSVPWRCC